MARLAATEGADWVINNDADEFWWPRAGSLKAIFEQLGDQVGMLLAHRENFVPRPEDGRPFWERMILRERVSLNPLGKPLPPKLAHRAHPEVEVAQGNHKVEGAELGESLDDGSIEILHFPMRTYGQFENKIVKGGRAYARNRELPQRHGPHLAAAVRGLGGRRAPRPLRGQRGRRGGAQRAGRGHAPAGLSAPLARQGRRAQYLVLT